MKKSNVMNKLLTALLILLCMFALPAQAEVIEVPAVTISAVEGPASSDELFYEYAMQKLYGMEDVAMFGVQARETLSEQMKALYDVIKPEVEKIAAGERTSTVFTFTPAQLAAMGFTTEAESFAALDAALTQQFSDYSRLIYALMRDCPYDLYWFDQLGNITRSGFSMSFDGTTASLYGDVSLTLPVSIKYRANAADDTVVNASFATSAKAAADKAAQIVAGGEGMSDAERLTYYAEQIMALVEYDDEAADNDTYSSDSNPWNLIHVFDGDPSTNVVCEGYSKAFQFLCDLTEFDNAQCYTVTGVMQGGTGAGGHMWNIVWLNGKNYLVDVTNTDDGTVGQDGSLFMAKADSGSVAEGYTVMGVNGTPVIYKYDSDLIWGDDVLKLAMAAPVASITNGSTVTPYMEFADALEDWNTNGGTLTLLDNVSHNRYIYLSPDATRTFDGGEYTLTLTGSEAMLYNFGTLTISGGAITAHDYYAILNYGTVTIEDGTITSHSQDYYAILNTRTLTIEGGTITAHDYSAIQNEGTLTIEGGTVYAPKDNATFDAILNFGSITLDGGSIFGCKGINNVGALTLQSGTVTASTSYALFNQGTATLSGATLITEDTNPVIICSGEDSTTTISGGKLSSLCSYMIARLEGADLIIEENNTDEDYCDGWTVHSIVPSAIGTDIVLPAKHYMFVNNKGVTNMEASETGIITYHPEHTYTYTADEENAIITCACTCGIDTHTAQLIAPAGTLVYDVEPHPATVEVTNSAAKPVVTYTLNGQTVDAAFHAGDYTATMTWGGAKVSVEYTIEPASISDAEVMVYPAEVTYNGTAQQPEVMVSMVFTSAAPDSGEDGSASIDKDVLLVEDEDYTLAYSDNTNAGTAKVTITGINNYTGTGEATFIINKAAAGVTTAPQAIEGLAYTGTPQALVSAGTAAGGTLLYSLDGQTWSEDIPNATDVGDYTVYYMVEGDSNHNDMAAQTVTASIGKGLASLTTVPTANNRTYNGTEQGLITAGATTSGTLLYSLDGSEWSVLIPTATNAGTYTVWYYVQGGSNHTDSDKAAMTVTIAPIELEIDNSDAAYAKTYDGTTSTAGVVWKQQPFLAEGVLPGDEVKLTDAAFPAYNSKDAGSRDAEISYELEGADALNYKLTNTTVTVTAIIDPKPLTAVTAEGSRTYDATANWIAPLALTGVIDGDEVHAMTEFQLPSKDVGVYTTATCAEPVLTGEDSNNYTLDPEDVTFQKATINKAAEGEWDITVATHQDILVGSGLDVISFPVSGTGIGNEAVAITGMTLYTDAAMENEATDADVSGLTEGQSITLYYQADATNYEVKNGSLVLNVIDHQHVWSYTVDEEANTIVGTCGSTIGTCPNATITYKLVIPTGIDFNSAAYLKVASCEITPANASGTEEAGISYAVESDNAALNENKPHNAGDYEVTMSVGGEVVTDTLTIDPATIGQPSSYKKEGVYTGEAHAPNVNIPYCRETYDYTVTYPEDMVNAGTKNITVTGIGNYTGSYTLAYEITSAPIDAAVITVADQIYTGEALEPAFTVTLNGRTLTPDTDFTFTWTNHVEVGTATIEIVGVGNYEGEAVGNFAIKLSGAEMTAQTAKAEYTYGETITVTATRAATGEAPVTFALRSAPAADQMALFLGDVQLSDAVDAVDGIYTMTYNTADKALAIGSNKLKVVYISNGNISDASAEVTVQLNRKELTITGATATSRKYAQGNQLVDVTAVTLSGIIATDEVSADLTAVQGTLSSDNAGDYTSLALPQLTLTGSEKDYYTIAADEDVTTDVTILKAALVGVELPKDAVLEVYLTTAEQVAAKLPATVTYTDGNGSTMALNVAWSCTGYDAAPGQQNVFTWTADTVALGNYELAENVPVTGTITVTNTDALPVTVTGSDATITYAGAAYDVKQLFAIDENAGAASYEIVSGGTGEATLSGSALTITKAGTVTIKVSTAANGAYSAGEATAVLTINKGNAAAVPTGLNAWYGQKLSEILLPVSTEGVWSWVNADSPVGAAGEQTHHAVFTPNNTDLWNTTTHDVTITVAQAATSFGEMKVYNGTAETTTFTYGETITVKAKATAVQPAAFGFRSLIAPAKHQMALFIRSADGSETQISAAVNEENGVYTMTYDTTGKALLIGDNTLIARFVGDENMADYQEQVTVKLNRKELTIHSLTAQSRAYEAGNRKVVIAGAELSGKADASDEVAIAGSMTGTISAADAGTYNEAVLPADVLLTGAHAGYYFAAGNVTVRIPQGVQITQAVPTTPTQIPARPVFDPIYQDGQTLGDISLSLPEGTFNVPGTIQWKDPVDTPVSEGTSYTWVFTPDDSNWAPVTGTVIVYPAGELPVITAPVTAQNVAVYEGGQATMAITATDASSYQWYINRNDGLGYVPINGATSSSYTTSVVNLGNNGFTYYCVANNAYGSADSPVFTLQVTEKAEVPVTGDKSNITMWLALTILSIMGITVTAMAGRKCKTTR